MDSEIPVFKLKGQYLGSFLVSRLLGIRIEAVRERVESKEMRGRIRPNGDVYVLDEDVFLSPESMAKVMCVSAKDVIEWIETGEFKAIAESGSYKIPYKEYSKFGRSGMWMSKTHENIFNYGKFLIEHGDIIDNVNKGFRRGMKPHIDKAREAIECLEKLHKYYENKVEVLSGKTPVVAGFMIMARLISLLYSALNLIEKEEIIGASVLFRSLYEGADLIEYFIFSAGTDEGDRRLKAWFRGKVIQHRVYRNFLAERYKQYMNKADILKYNENEDVLYSGYSNFVHLSFEPIMESYNVFSSSGFGKELVHKMGFDYKNTRLLRKSVAYLDTLESLLRGIIMRFILCFNDSLSLTVEHVALLKKWNDYYAKGVGARNKILRNNEKK